MSVLRLTPRPVARPWGRPSPKLNGQVLAGGQGGERIGEIWFEAPLERDEPLMLKLLFTSEPLSVQVHPGNEDAEERGHRCGKEEAWYVLEAEPGAQVAHGLREATTPAQLRRMSSSGAIAERLQMRTAQPGDFIHVPPGTVHAIGAGLVLAEVQQRIDLTYRLYDYGRPRPLQLLEGVDVAVAGPAPQELPANELGPGRLCLVDGGAFRIERRSAACSDPVAPGARGGCWVLPIEGTVEIGKELLRPGDCALVDSPEEVHWKTLAGVLLVAVAT